MRGLDHFSLALESLKNEELIKHFEVDSYFFSEFENAPINECNFKVEVRLFRDNSNIDIKVVADGKFKTICDRCIADINLPYSFETEVFMKISDEENPADIETYYVGETATHINLAPIVYEALCLHMPMIRTYACEDEDPRPCDDNTLERLDDVDFGETNDPWEALKNVDLN